MEGFRPGKKENKLGIRASDTAEVVMENCFVSEDRLLGEEGEGFVQALQILDGGRISIAALGLGTAIGAFDTALAYSKEREQFGKPIAEFQAIQFALAEMATRIAAAEILTFAAAEAMDRGEQGVAPRLRGQALHRRGGRLLLRARRPDPRRLRLHQGLPGREVLPRRQDLHHRRGHERDPAAGDRAAQLLKGR